MIGPSNVVGAAQVASSTNASSAEENVVALVVAVLLVGYLVAVLLFPERF
jgi:K+-transporting ATPase KdpF subunit